MIPGIEVPSRRSLTGLVAKECESTMSTVRERIRQSSDKITISCDIATTKGMKASFLGVAAHYWCDQSNSFEVAALECVDIEGRHTGVEIASLLKKFCMMLI
uniref:Uncharacterized protein n=1 Tax=Ditylenchus dipsaci TaxID=166011 RepID=A0A915E309_9BILA